MPADEPEAHELSDDELGEYQEASTRRVKDEMLLRAFPPAGVGFSHCENGYCYVSCGNGWLQLYNGDTPVRCGTGRWRFNCGSTNYQAFRCD